MSFIRSERAAAGILLGAAVLGLVLANTGLGPDLMSIQDRRIGFAWLGLDFSIGHWISDGLLAIFFFLIAIELRHELTVGELDSPGKAIRPAIAALGGVVVPAGIYLAITAGSGYAGGWPVPTATDIAFALGVLAVFGKGLPGHVRVFLLALAVLDDLIAILIIAVFFTSDASLVMLVPAVLALVVFALLSAVLERLRARPALRAAVAVVLVILAVLTWALVHRSGVHATVAGVALGLAMARKPAARTRHALEPFSNTAVLPVFAFSAALVAIPQVGIMNLAAPFWGILIALPLGKMIGITLGGLVGSMVGTITRRPQRDLHALLVVSSLGGIGFTVSLLMNELAFRGSAQVSDEGTLAVLLGSGVSMVVAALLVSAAARRHRKRAESHH